jgi:hypothetical protein
MKTLYPFFFTGNPQSGGVLHREAREGCGCKCTKEGIRRHQVSMAEEDFSKPYNDVGLSVKQVRIKAGKRIIGRWKSIVEHPFRTIKRGMNAGYCLPEDYAM